MQQRPNRRSEINPFDKVKLELNRKITSLAEENAALKDRVAHLERTPEIESAEYRTWWELALHVGAWKYHDLDYVHFGSEMAVRAFAIHLLRQRDKLEAEQQQTITTLKSRSAALVNALETTVPYLWNSSTIGADVVAEQTLAVIKGEK